MRRSWLLAASWSALLFGVAVAADEATPAKPADWSAYATGTKVAGTVSDVSESALMLRIPSAGGRGKTKETELELTFAPAALVRWNKLPVEKDDKGNKKLLPPSEQARLKQPAGAPGWAASREDLSAGQVVEVTLVRPREVPASKAQTTDLRVKYVVIHGEDPRGTPAGWEGKAKPKEKEKVAEKKQ